MQSLLSRSCVDLSTGELISLMLLPPAQPWSKMRQVDKPRSACSVEVLGPQEVTKERQNEPTRITDLTFDQVKSKR